MVSARRGPVRVFAVEDTAVQLIWRDVPAGELRFTVHHEDGRTIDAPDRSAPVADDGAPGGIVLDGLPADRTLEVRTTLDGDPLAAVPVRTAAPLPGAERCRVATIGDLHLGANVFGHRGTIAEVEEHAEPHPIRCARAAVDDAVAWGAQRIVAKGDVTNHGQVPQWRAFADLVAHADVPIDALPGNHDNAHPARTHSMLPDDAAAVFGLSLADPIITRDLPGLRLVLADTTEPGRNRGFLAPVLRDILDAAADADPDDSVLIAVHHQLHPWHGPEGWPVGIPHREAVDLLERLARVHPRALVTSGHTHRHRRWEHDGVTTTQVGSTKDYPGVWAGYVVAEGGLRQVVRRVTRPDCISWTDRTRRAAFGAWRFVGPGPISSRCFDLVW